MSLTINRMQEYLYEKYKISKPEDLKNTQRYFYKLIEEVGELSEAIRKNNRMEDNNIKGTIEEELSDVLYYTLMIANTYDIDLEKCFRLKEELNAKRYRRLTVFSTSSLWAALVTIFEADTPRFNDTVTGSPSRIMPSRCVSQSSAQAETIPKKVQQAITYVK